MQAQIAKFTKLVGEANEKNAKPRVIREYRTVKEYYPWRTVAIPAVFPLIGFFLLIKSAADFSKAFKFGGVFYLILALIFVGIGILFAYPSKSDFTSCKRLRETFKTAENRGKRYQATILGYKTNVAGVIPAAKGAGAPKIALNYVLEVEFLEDTKYKTIESKELKYHPNAVLKSTRCNVFFYDGEYFVGNYDLRTGKSDETAEIPQKGMVGGEM